MGSPLYGRLVLDGETLADAGSVDAERHLDHAAGRRDIAVGR
jgi:hypothetical protein